MKKRWAIKLALCLLAGAVVTWAVAWGCVLLIPQTMQPNQLVLARGREGDVPAYVGRGVGVEVWLLGSQYRDGPEVAMPDWVTTWPRVDVEGMNLGGGLPFRALALRTGLKGGAYLVDRGWSVKKDDGEIFLPLRIIPLGFALNTLLAAGVLLGVVETVAFARRRRRRNKGRCPSCGYDRGGLAEGAACPECGGKA